ncbi:protein YIPF6 isoform X2 [Rhipicephalus sanguineus]|uniref:protein YIPF6 isoform X2 n=1 Tax=Rhipicephalus sanguineus TaxID=34632 RepID=UPI0018938987|nr:protein YIPF6 isoform X2 [Rhipicephalus sanguineus]
MVVRASFGKHYCYCIVVSGSSGYQRPPYQDYDTPLEGDIAAAATPSEEREFNTLDEPVLTTIVRDLKAIGIKFAHVLYPKQKNTILRDWDLWGPLILCVFLAMMLQQPEDEKIHSGAPQFAQIFVLVWLGAGIVTLNCRLLGGTISFFQSVCVLGYCLLAPCVALVICRIILLAGNQTVGLFVLRFFVSMLGFGWAVFASTAFLADSQPSSKKALAVYPICLFYFVISWLILARSP